MRSATALIHAPLTTAELCTACDVQPKSIVIQRARVRLTRDRQGEWNFEDLVQALKFESEPCHEWIPIQLDDSQIIIVDQSVTPPRQIQLEQIQASIRPIQYRGETILDIKGSFAGVASATLRFHAQVNPVRKIWRTQFTTDDAVLNMDLLANLPESIRQKLVGLRSLSGTATCRGDLAGDFQSVPQYRITGQLHRFSAAHRDFPAPLINASTEFEIDNTQVRLTNAAGQVGEGRFRLRECGKRLDGTQHWYAVGEVNQFLFNSRLEKWLPPSCVNFMHDFNPAGVADVKFDIVQQGKTTIRRRLNANLTDMSFLYIKVPFQLNRCAGSVDWIDNVMTFDVTANERDQPIRFQGTVNNPGPRSTYQVDIDVPGSLPIDEKLRQAIQCYPMLSAAVDNLRIHGRVRGRGRIVKPASGPTAGGQDHAGRVGPVQCPPSLF